MKWIPRIIRMRIHHRENKVGLFNCALQQHESLNTSEIVERDDIMTGEEIRRF